MLTGSDDPQTAARFLREQGVRDVAMKLGAEGCIVVTPEISFHSPGFQVPTVDTTGAGDCFAGAFLAALFRGESYERAACFANAVGAMAVRQLGAISGIRPYQETMAWFERAKRQAAE
jgi:sugar/nucleoside kinase (ribokinase family)